MSPDAPTSPPGSASGLNFFQLRSRQADGTEPDPRAFTCIEGPALPFTHEPRFRRNEMKKIFTMLVLSATILTAAACNTVRGAGRDIESTANAVDNHM